MPKLKKLKGKKTEVQIENSHSKTSRLFSFSIIFCCLALAVILRGNNYNFVFSNVAGHLNFIDPDDYYYLRMLVHFLDHFPSIMTFDPLADWPKGAPVDWTEGHLLTLGLPLKLLGVHSFRAMELGACCIMVSLGLLTILSIYLLARRFLKNWPATILVFFLASMNFLLIRFSCFGTVDHHIWEAFFPPLSLLLAFKTFEDKNKLSAVYLGLLLTFSLSISSSSVFTIGALFAAYGFVLGRKENLKEYGIFVLTFLASLIPYALLEIHLRGNPSSPVHASFFHVLLVSALALIAILVSRYRSKIKFVLPIVAGVSLLCFYLKWPALLILPFKEALTYVFGGGLLENVSEATPIYMMFEKVDLNFMHLNFGYLIYILPLVYPLLFLYKRFSREQQAFILVLSMLAIPGVMQKRFSHLMVGMFLIFVGWSLDKLLDFCDRRDLRLKGILIFLFIFLMTIPGVQFGFSPSPAARDRIDLGTAALVIKNFKIDPDEAWSRLALNTPVREGIWCNPNQGNLLLYITGLGVVTDGFYHYGGFNIDFKIRTIESEPDLITFLREKKIGYLIAVDDWKYFELLMKEYGKDFSPYVVFQNVNGRVGRYYSTSALEKLAWVRLITKQEHDPALKEEFSVRFNESYFYTFVRGYRLNLENP